MPTDGQRPRLTITIENDLLQALDSLVDGDLLRNRSQAIEHFLKEGLGAYRIRQAFLFFEAGWLPAQLEEVLDLCAAQKIETLFLGLPSSDPVLSTAVQASLAQWQASHTGIQTHTVPADFGSGAAVLLQKTSLEHPFLICWIGPRLQVPASLLAPLLFHGRHGSVLTLLQSAAPGGLFQLAGLAIAQPELLRHIPAGLSDLGADIFPELAKLGTVRAYVLPPR
jgi:hypothetical protein